MIVADANLIAYLTIQSEHSAAADAVFEQDPVWAAPPLWRSEYRNTLANYLRNGKMTMESALVSLQTAEAAVGGREYGVESEKILTLSKESGCSAYDCEYVGLAKDLGVLLVTTDKRILRAFPKVAVALEQFSKSK